MTLSPAVTQFVIYVVSSAACAGHARAPGLLVAFMHRPVLSGLPPPGSPTSPLQIGCTLAGTKVEMSEDERMAYKDDFEDLAGDKENPNITWSAEAIPAS